MNNQKLQNFIGLVAFDQTFLELEQSIQELKKNIQNLKNNLVAIENNLNKKKEKKKELSKSLDKQELLLKDIQDKEEKATSVLDSSQNSKEFDAANSELDKIKADREIGELKLLKIYNDHEAIEKDLNLAAKKYEEEVFKVDEIVKKESSELDKFQADLDQKSKDRDQRLSDIPDEWIDLYEYMRGKVIDPVVPIIQDSCSVCFNLVSSRDLQHIKSGELIQCKDCYRFLYLGDIPEKVE